MSAASQTSQELSQAKDAKFPEMETTGGNTSDTNPYSEAAASEAKKVVDSRAAEPRDASSATLSNVKLLQIDKSREITARSAVGGGASAKAETTMERILSSCCVQLERMNSIKSQHVKNVDDEITAVGSLQNPLVENNGATQAVQIRDSVCDSLPVDGANVPDDKKSLENDQISKIGIPSTRQALSSYDSRKIESKNVVSTGDTLPDISMDVILRMEQSLHDRDYYLYARTFIDKDVEKLLTDKTAMLSDGKTLVDEPKTTNDDEQSRIEKVAPATENRDIDDGVDQGNTPKSVDSVTLNENKDEKLPLEGNTSITVEASATDDKSSSVTDEVHVNKDDKLSSLVPDKEDTGVIVEASAIDAKTSSVTDTTHMDKDKKLSSLVPDEKDTGVTVHPSVIDNDLTDTVSANKNEKSSPTIPAKDPPTDMKTLVNEPNESSQANQGVVNKDVQNSRSYKTNAGEDVEQAPENNATHADGIPRSLETADTGGCVKDEKASSLITDLQDMKWLRGSSGSEYVHVIFYINSSFLCLFL